MSAGPAHRVQSAEPEFGFPSGHLGHLTADQESQLRAFKELVIEKGYYKPQTDEHDYGTHDDAMLLRFLRARRFNVQDAFTQFKETEDWRTANSIDLLYETIELADFEETWRLYPQWTGRRDKRGIPVYVFEVKHLNSKAMAAYEKSASKTKTAAKTDGKTPAKLLGLFALYENLVRFTMPLCTALSDRDHPRTPITQSNNIVDISGVGLKQFWNLRSHMQDASTLATAHYPETLDRIFIIGAPSFFPTVWGWIKRWFDPITTSKIFILGAHETKSVLESFIAPENIPKKYGGQLDFEFGVHSSTVDPALTDSIEWENGHTHFPAGPAYWLDRGDKIELRSAGYEKKTPRKENICIVRKKVQTHSLDNPPTRPATVPHQSGQMAGTTGVIQSRPELLSIPTERESIPKSTPQGVADESPEPQTPTEDELARADEETKAAEHVPVFQAGEIVPASRPEPVKFHTAVDNLQKLSMNDGNADEASAETAVLSSGPHVTTTANLLDPAINNSTVPIEHATAAKPTTDHAVAASEQTSLKEKLVEKMQH